MIIPADYEKMGITELYILKHDYAYGKNQYEPFYTACDEIVGKMDGQYFKATCYWSVNRGHEKSHGLRYKTQISQEEYERLVGEAKKAEEEKKRHPPQLGSSYPPSYYRKRRRHSD